jgi:hypothetical protein
LLTHKETGLPFAEDLETCVDLPHTITAAIMHVVRIRHLQELPKNKRPPYGIWDKSWRLEEFLDHVWDAPDESSKGKGKDYAEYNPEDVE